MSKLVHLVSCPLPNIVLWLFARGWQKLDEKMMGHSTLKRKGVRNNSTDLRRKGN
jgi:hypothetical protein